MQITGFDLLNMTNIEGGKLSATIFLQGCNLRCPYCYNTSLLAQTTEQEFSQKEVIEKIKQRENVLQGVCITGGEPTMDYYGLLRLVREIKEVMGKGFYIKLDTNGTIPHHLTSDLLECIDYIAMDIKSPKVFINNQKIGEPEHKEMLNYFEKLRQSLWTIEENHVPYEFRTTMFTKEEFEKELVNEYRDFEKKFFDEVQTLNHQMVTYYLQHFTKTDTVLDQNTQEVTEVEVRRWQVELEPLFRQIVIRN